MKVLKNAKGSPEFGIMQTNSQLPVPHSIHLFGISSF